MKDEVTLRYFDVAARVFIASLFLYSGFGKLMDPAAVAARLDAIGFPMGSIAAYATIAIELGASAALIFGYRVLIACALLAGFTLIASFLFHQFWAVEAAQRTGQVIHFMKSLAIVGGLWFVARSALEARLSRGGALSTKPA
jgi:putative oxidoreductase